MEVELHLKRPTKPCPAVSSHYRWRANGRGRGGEAGGPSVVLWWSLPRTMKETTRVVNTKGNNQA
jgi:hypothetical protein